MTQRVIVEEDDDDDENAAEEKKAKKLAESAAKKAKRDGDAWKERTGLALAEKLIKDRPSDKDFEELMKLLREVEKNEQHRGIEEAFMLRHGSLLPAIRQDQIRYCHSLYHSHPLLRTVSDITKRALLGGGISFESKRHKERVSHEVLFEHTWMQFAEAAIDSLLKYGLAIVVVLSHPTLVAHPTVLQLDQCETRMYQTAYNQRFYSVNDTSNRLTADEPGGKPISAFLICETDPPLGDGTLQSKTLVVGRQIEMYEDFRRQYLRSQHVNAVAPLVIRKEQQKDAGTTFHGSSGAAGMPLPPTGAMDPNPIESVQHAVPLHDTLNGNVSDIERHRLEERVKRILDTEPGVSKEEARRRVYKTQGAASYETIGPDGIPLITLPDGYVGDKAVSANESRYLEYFDRSTRDVVAGVFGIPADLFGDTRGNRAGNADHRLLYYDTIRGLRQKLQMVLHRVYMFIYADVGSDHLIVASDEHHTSELLADVKVQITLPGVLPMEKVDEWYDKGLITTATYTSMLARAYSLPSGIFESKQVLPYVDAPYGNATSAATGKNIQPPPKPGQASSSSSAAKPKPKAKAKPKAKPTTPNSSSDVGKRKKQDARQSAKASSGTSSSSK